MMKKIYHTLDAIFVFDHFGGLVPVANQLLACSPFQHPLFVLRLTK